MMGTMSIFPRVRITCLSVLLILTCVCPTMAADWTVIATIHEIESLTDDDASGPDDFYAITEITAVSPAQGTHRCDRKLGHPDDDNHIFPNWDCVAKVSGESDTTVEVTLMIFDHDSSSADDHFDSHSASNRMDVVAAFKPATHYMKIHDFADWESYQCARKATINGSDGDDQAKVVFSIVASLTGWPNGDSDNDGFTDTEEVCGIDYEGDGVVDVDLPAMGAKPLRPDLFVEVDWMVDTHHSHEPWLPALINSWHEFDDLPVTNPKQIDGTSTPAGIALHVDVGTLYADYQMDFDLNIDLGNEPADIIVGPDGNVDLDGDGIPDIGNLGALGNGTVGGGNPLAEHDEFLDHAPSSDPTDVNYFGPGSDFAAIKAANFDPIRRGVFRYAVFAHQLMSSEDIMPEVTGGLACGGINSAGIPTSCDDFIVSLGGWSRPGPDIDGDGVSDYTIPILPGPSGLPVDGQIPDHTGVFMHELGHTLALDHGGGDETNFKPNYLSVMNYHFLWRGVQYDFDGDGMTDTVGRDYDQNGFDDPSRFTYSTEALPTLDENALVEEDGIQDHEALTMYTCPNGTILPADGDGPINWDCDGDGTIDVNPVPVDIADDEKHPDPILKGFDDRTVIRDGHLDSVDDAPYISLQELRELQSRTRRIMVLKSEQALADRCESLTRIDFENFPPETAIDNQYAPAASFLNDNKRTPTILRVIPEDPNLTTQSPDQYLINKFHTNPVELVITFELPQRQVGLYFGARGPVGPQDIAVLTAFDRWDTPMGSVVQPLHSDPSLPSGITEFLGIGAIFGNELIKRIELKYDTQAPDVAAQIDDLVLCDKLDETGIVPIFPEPPEFGDLPVTITVHTAKIGTTAGGDTEEGHNWSFVEVPVTGIPITVNDGVTNTNFSITKPEGQNMNFAAPMAFTLGGERLEFLHWKFDTNTFFSDGQSQISFPLLHNATVTAVFGGRSYRAVVAAELKHEK